MKDLLLYILSHIVEKEKVDLQEEEEDGIVVFRIRVPKEEVGKVIGKGGKTVNSIKNILKILSFKEGKRVSIEVQEK